MINFNLRCPLCDFDSKSKGSLSKHISYKHQLTSIETKLLMLNTYPDLFDNCLGCDIKIPKYPNEGGSRCCSADCSIYVRKNKNKGRKQSAEHIEKRINNTDQKEKEKTRISTMLKKYDVTNCSHLPDVKVFMKSVNTGSKRPRTIEHQQKIIESKRKNDNLKHKDATKDKISKTLKLIYQTIDAPCSLSKNTGNNGRGHKNGTYKGYNYRSSYELIFIKYCLDNNIRITAADNKNFRIRYYYDGRYRHYYPDFYLDDYDMIIEIKPMSLYNDPLNMEKFHIACKHYAYSIITEEELINLDYYFKDLGEPIYNECFLRE